jgi:hypothetical protein
LRITNSRYCCGRLQPLPGWLSAVHPDGHFTAGLSDKSDGTVNLNERWGNAALACKAETEQRRKYRK